jgi:hypothetical protein
MAEEIPTELVLAAMERAKCQERYEWPGLHINPIKEHLGVFRRSPYLGRLLNRMMTEGLVENTRTQGANWWAITTAGRRRLNKARKAGSLGELPESPQHKAWRTAHGLAETEIERFRLELGALQGELSELLLKELPGHEAPGHDSDAWFKIAGALDEACWRMGSARHCLHEWDEPSEDGPDVDQILRPGEKELEERERGRIFSRRQARRDFRRWPRTS